MLFAETEDRVSRGSYALIARLLTKCGVQIVVTGTGERESTAKTARRGDIPRRYVDDLRGTVPTVRKES